MNLKSKMTAYEYKSQANANDVDIRCVCMFQSPPEAKVVDEEV